MKNKLRALYQAVRRRVVRWVRHFTDEQLGMRILSLVLAVVMWAVVMSRDDARRFTTVSGLTVEILGEDTLAENELAIKQSLRELTQRSVSVRLEGTKALLTALNKENLRVVVDLSRITATGEDQTISLQVRNASGLSVTGISPYDAVTVDVESLYSREIPVVAQTDGELPAGHMIPSNSISVTPSTVTVTGTESDVTRISAAYVYVDLTDVTESVRAQQEVTLVDAQGSEVVSSVEVSDPTVIVGFPVYQTKTVAVEWRGSVTGEVASGYELSGASVFPEQVTIAGYASDLAGIEKVFVSAISVDGKSEPFTQDVSFIGQTGIRWMNYESAQVTLKIQEERETVIVSEVPFEIVNAPQGARVECSADTVTVAVVGPASFMKNLSRDDFTAKVDLLSAVYGTTPMPVTFTVTNPDAPELSFMQVSVEVTLTKE